MQQPFNYSYGRDIWLLKSTWPTFYSPMDIQQAFAYNILCSFVFKNLASGSNGIHLDWYSIHAETFSDKQPVTVTQTQMVTLFYRKVYNGFPSHADKPLIRLCACVTYHSIAPTPPAGGRRRGWERGNTLLVVPLPGVTKSHTSTIPR